MRDPAAEAPAPDSADWLRPPWARTDIGAVMSTRRGGVSQPPWQGFNLGDHVGDVPAAVAANRAAFAAATGARPVYLRQVHGTRVVRLQPHDAEPGAAVHEADGCVTTVPGLACTILVADCLPVLFAAPGRRGVAAAHAGWRGLAGGVLEHTLAALCEAAACAPAEVDAWIGVGIGPQRFEVGADVLQAFGEDPGGQAPGFSPRAPVAGRATWCADLPRLAAARLQRAGVQRLDVAAGCTAGEASRFFSFRRDGPTGRQAAAVWIRDGRD